jgi:hypothetical protein
MISETTPEKMASALVGFDITLLRIEHTALILSKLEFMSTPIYFLNEIEPIDIGLESWEKMNNSNTQFAKCPNNHYLAAIEVVKIYYGIDISKELAGYAMPYVADLFAQFDAFGERFSDLGNDVPDDNMIAAGIEKINAFGFFPTLDTLAKGNILEYDVILQQPAITVYSKLLLDKTIRDYTQELNRINAFLHKNGVHTDS